MRLLNHQTASTAGKVTVSPETTHASSSLFLAILFLLMMLLQVISLTIPEQTIWRTGLAMASAILTLTAIGQSKPLERRLPLGLILTGIVVFVFTRVPYDRWIHGFAYMFDLAALVAVAPIIQLLFARRQYSKALVKTMSISSDFKMMAWSSISIHLLGVVSLVGAFPIVYEMMLSRKGVMGKDRFDDLMVRSMIQGFGVTAVWSPVSPNMAIALSVAGLRWTEVLPWVLPLAIGAMLLSLLEQRFYLWIRSRREQTQLPAVQRPVMPRVGRQMVPPVQDRVSREDVLRCLELLVLLIVFPTTVVLLEHGTGWPILALVPFVAVIMTLLGFLLTGEKGCLEEVQTFFVKHVPHKTKQMVLFLAAGVAAYALKESGLASQLILGLNGLFGSEAAAFLLVLPPTIAISSMAGFPPLVIVALLAASIDPATLQLEPVQLVFALAGGASLGLILSPVAGSVVITSSMTSRDAFRVGIRTNGVFALLLFFYVEAALLLL